MTITAIVDFLCCPKEKFKVKVKIFAAVPNELRSMNDKKQKFTDLIGICSTWKLFPDGTVGLCAMVRTEAGQLTERQSVAIDFSDIIKKQKLEKIIKIIDESPWSIEEKKIFLKKCTNHNLDWEKELKKETA